MTSWITKQLVHEGFPLFIRHPQKLDTHSHRKEYSNLIVLKHKFSQVLANGLPDPDYNDSLKHLDADICNAFELTKQGIPVLIETFGGRRNYYFYAMTITNVEMLVVNLKKHYPDENLSSSVHPDPDWNFIEKYSGEFLS